MGCNISKPTPIYEPINVGKFSILELIGKGSFGKDACISIISEIASALLYLHSIGIIHRDVKPENILFDDKGHAHLSDFNFAIRTNGGKTVKSIVDMAPEVFNNGAYSFPVDFWALGVTFYETVSGQRPFKSRNRRELIKKGKFSFVPEIPLSEDCKNCISEFLQVNPEARLGCGEAGVEKLHSQRFFRSIRWDQVDNKNNIPLFRQTRLPCEDVDIPEIGDFTSVKQQPATFKQEYQKIFNDFTYFDYSILKPVKFSPIEIPESSRKMLRENYNDISYIDTGFATRNNSLKRDVGILKSQQTNTQSDPSNQKSSEEVFHIGGLRSFTSNLQSEEQVNPERTERPMFTRALSQIEKKARFEKRGPSSSFIRNESRAFSPSQYQRRIDDSDSVHYYKKKDLHSSIFSNGESSPEDDTIILFPFRTAEEEEMQNTVSNADKTYVSSSTIGINNFRSSNSSISAIKSFHKNSQQSISRKTPLSSLLWLEYSRSSDIRRRSNNIEEEIESFENGMIGTPTSQLSNSAKPETSSDAEILNTISGQDIENPAKRWTRQSVASIGKSGSIISTQSHLSVRSTNLEGKHLSPGPSFVKPTNSENNSTTSERRSYAGDSSPLDYGNSKLEPFPTKTHNITTEKENEHAKDDNPAKAILVNESERVSEMLSPGKQSPEQVLRKTSNRRASAADNSAKSDDTNLSPSHVPLNPLFLDRKPGQRQPANEGLRLNPSIRRRRAQTVATASDLETEVQLPYKIGTRAKNESKLSNENSKTSMTESRALIPVNSIKNDLYAGIKGEKAIPQEKDKRKERSHTVGNEPGTNTNQPGTNTNQPPHKEVAQEKSVAGKRISLQEGHTNLSDNRRISRSSETSAPSPSQSRSNSVPWPTQKTVGSIRGREDSVKKRTRSASQDSQILIQLQKPTFIDPVTGKSIKPSPLQKVSALKNQIETDLSGTVGSLASIENDDTNAIVKKPSIRKASGLNRINTSVVKDEVVPNSAPAKHSVLGESANSKSPLGYLKHDSAPIATDHYSVSPQQSEVNENVFDSNFAEKMPEQSATHIPKSPTVPKNFFHGVVREDPATAIKEEPNLSNSTTARDIDDLQDTDKTKDIERTSSVKNHRAERRASQKKDQSRKYSANNLGPNDADERREKSSQSLARDPNSSLSIADSNSTSDVHKSIPRRLDKLENAPKIHERVESTPKVLKSAILTNE